MGWASGSPSAPHGLDKRVKCLSKMGSLEPLYGSARNRAGVPQRAPPGSYENLMLQEHRVTTAPCLAQQGSPT